MEIEIRQSILKTVLYADIFDYPLSSDELWQFLISNEKIKKKDFLRTLNKVKKPIVFSNGFYHLYGRENIVKKRKEKLKENKKKFLIAKRVSRILSAIPSILLIAISGGLSMENADKNDDIDVFIITKRNTIWSTRIFIIFILKLLGKHRTRLDKKVKDKICLNMLLDEERMGLDKGKQNLYSAHEISQMKITFNRNHTHEKFILANLWVKKFIPNAIGKTERKIAKEDRNIFFQLQKIIEPIVRKVQVVKIEKNKSIETISDTLLAFHPFDYDRFVMSAYNKRLKKYGQKI